MPTSSKQLEQVRALIKTGKKKQAVNELARLIEKDHDNPELWWLLANASEDYHQARRALDEMQVLAPDDPRAEKMLRRLDTRIKLDQMGLRPSKPENANRRVLVFAGAAIALVIILGVAFIALTGGFNPREEITLPTQAVFETTPTEVTATPTTVPPTETQTPTFTASPTNTQQAQVIPPTAGLPAAEVTSESTVESVAPTKNPFLAPPTGQPVFPTQAFPTMPVTPGVLLPTTNPFNMTPVEPSSGTQVSGLPTREAPLLTIAESTQEVGVPTSFVAIPSPTPFGFVPSPTPFGFVASPTMFMIFTPTATLVPTIAPLDRGQLVNGTPRRDLIEPYGVHSYTFSGYRDEKIRIELRNLSGEGNPSLELRNQNNEIITSDIDTTSAQNLDSLIEISLPDDGIYTLIIRMAAVEEQLYFISLTRGE